MKPPLESIKAAHNNATDMNTVSFFAVVALAQAGTAIKCTSPAHAKERLTEARYFLKKLRRTQTAALANIDEALKTL